MILVTTENVAGYKVQEVKGQVFGIVVRSRGAIPNFFAQIKSFFGGEISEYTSMLEDARSQALDRMTKNAIALGANGIIMFRFDSSSMDGNMSETIAYGTAVWLDKLDD